MHEAKLEVHQADDRPRASESTEQKRNLASADSRRVCQPSTRARRRRHHHELISSRFFYANKKPKESTFGKNAVERLPFQRCRSSYFRTWSLLQFVIPQFA